MVDIFEFCFQEHELLQKTSGNFQRNLLQQWAKEVGNLAPLPKLVEAAEIQLATASQHISTSPRNQKLDLFNLI